MEDTMSSYSFSHQFYQRWTCAPEPVRAAITQELKDITTLLQSDTSFEDFTFNTHDLDAHVDELYDNYNPEQAIAKAITDKQEQEDAAAAKQKLEAEQKKKETEKKHRYCQSCRRIQPHRYYLQGSYHERTLSISYIHNINIRLMHE